jgi:hypothetical protein
MEPPKFMKNSKPDSDPNDPGLILKETTSPYALDLPVSRDFPATPPKGSWGD